EATADAWKVVAIEPTQIDRQRFWIASSAADEDSYFLIGDPHTIENEAALFNQGCAIGLNVIKEAEVRYRQTNDHVTYSSDLAELRGLALLPQLFGADANRFLQTSYSIGSITPCTFTVTGKGADRLFQTVHGGVWQAMTCTLQYPNHLAVGSWTPSFRRYTPPGAAVLAVADLADLAGRPNSDGQPTVLPNLHDFTTSPATVQMALN